MSDAAAASDAVAWWQVAPLVVIMPVRDSAGDAAGESVVTLTKGLPKDAGSKAVTTTPEVDDVIVGVIGALWDKTRSF